MVKDWNKIIVILTLLTLILVGYQTFISQPKTDTTLQQIAYNTYSPKPFLSGNAQCYIIESENIQKYFLLNYTKSYYADIFTMHVTGASASNPWMKITIPEGIEYNSISSTPKGTQTIKNETLYSGGKQAVVSVSWDTKIPPEGDVRVIILYDTENIDSLKSKPRIYTFGSTEITGYTQYLNCYNIEIFTGFQ